MARALFLTQVLPYPLDSGAKIRQYHMLQHLGQRHDVTLLSFVREDNLAEHIDHLRGVCDDVHAVPMRRSAVRNARALVRSLLTGMPAVIARDEIGGMRDLILHLSADEPFDIVHADQVSMAQYSLMARALGSKGALAPCLLDMHNAMFLVLQRLAADEANPAKRWPL